MRLPTSCSLSIFYSLLHFAVEWAAKITESCEKIEMPAVASSFSRESHEVVRSLDYRIAHAIDDHRNKSKKEVL